MFIRTTHIGIKDGAWDEAIGRFRDQAVPRLESQPGFFRVILTGDPETGRATIITMWQSADHGGGAGEGGDDVSVAALGDLVVDGPASSGYREILEREF